MIVRGCVSSRFRPFQQQRPINIGLHVFLDYRISSTSPCWSRSIIRFSCLRLSGFSGIVCRTFASSHLCILCQCPLTLARFFLDLYSGGLSPPCLELKLISSFLYKIEVFDNIAFFITKKLVAFKSRKEYFCMVKLNCSQRSLLISANVLTSYNNFFRCLRIS